LEAGADERISPSQFGFTRKRSTEDALYCARRAIEKAWAHRGGAVHLLALDWRMAFDSINSESLISALKRFGLPSHILKIVCAVYTDRCFNVNECGVLSELRTQDSGICQGCPLSPFLFVIVMSVLMSDAKRHMCSDARSALEED
jgi:hypothetical protein